MNNLALVCLCTLDNRESIFQQTKEIVGMRIRPPSPPPQDPDPTLSPKKTDQDPTLEKRV